MEDIVSLKPIRVLEIHKKNKPKSIDKDVPTSKTSHVSKPIYSDTMKFFLKLFYSNDFIFIKVIYTSKEVLSIFRERK